MGSTVAKWLALESSVSILRFLSQTQTHLSVLHLHNLGRLSCALQTFDHSKAKAASFGKQTPRFDSPKPCACVCAWTCKAARARTRKSHYEVELRQSREDFFPCEDSNRTSFTQRLFWKEKSVCIACVCVCVCVCARRLAADCRKFSLTRRCFANLCATFGKRLRKTLGGALYEHGCR